jgi:hypothetical protein
MPFPRRRESIQKRKKPPARKPWRFFFGQLVFFFESRLMAENLNRYAPIKMALDRPFVEETWNCLSHN